MDHTAQAAIWEAKKQARAFAAKQLQAAHPYLIPNDGNNLVSAAKNIMSQALVTASAAEILNLVRFIKSHGHQAWLCGDETLAPQDLSIGVIETYTQDGASGARRVILEKPTLQSVRDWLGY